MAISSNSTSSKDKEQQKLRYYLNFAGRSELIQLLGSNVANSEQTDALSADEQISQLQQENSKDIVIKLLWCYLKTKEGELPYSFIASSLAEDLAAHKSVEENTLPLLAFVYNNILTELDKEKEHRLGLLTSEKIIENIFKSNLTDESFKEEKIKLVSNLSKFISIEEENSIKRKETRDYLVFLENLKNKLSNSKAEKKIELSTTPIEKSLKEESKRGNFSTGEFTLGDPTGEFRIPEERLHEESKSKIIGIAPNIGINEEAKSIDYEALNETNKSRKNNIALILSALIVLSLLFYNSELIKEKLKGITNLSFLRTTDIRDNISFNPTLEDIKVLPVAGTLPDLAQLEKKYSLDSLTERLTTARVDTSSGTITEVPSSKPASSPSKEVDPNKPVDLEEVESLNTIPDKGPSNNTASNTVNTTATPEIKKPLPKLPPVNLPTNTNTTDLGNTDKGNALDGSPLKSYVVEKYDPPLIYKTTTATDILSAPSLFAAKLTRVESGTPIRVTSKMGQWVEIRSNAGRLGYLFAKDAVPE